MPRPVLIVDDDPDTRSALEMFLSDNGFDIVTAADGLEAIEKAIGRERPCAIILDDRMPLMTGLEFLTRLEADPRLSEIPVIFATGDPHTQSEIERRGGVAFLKPYDPDVLLGVVKEHCS